MILPLMLHLKDEIFKRGLVLLMLLGFGVISHV